jgi:hypothetical protein
VLRYPEALAIAAIHCQDIPGAGHPPGPCLAYLQVAGGVLTSRPVRVRQGQRRSAGVHPARCHCSPTRPANVARPGRKAQATWGAGVSPACDMLVSGGGGQTSPSSSFRAPKAGETPARRLAPPGLLDRGSASLLWPSMAHARQHSTPAPSASRISVTRWNASLPAARELWTSRLRNAGCSPRKTGHRKQ